MISANTLSNNAEKVLRQIERLSEEKFLPIIGPKRGQILCEEVRKAGPKRVLEVGTLIGYSAILIGKELKKDSEIVTIEIHQEETEIAKENILKAKILPKVTFIAGNAIKIIPTLTGSFDFAFIDAEKTEYLQYLSLSEPKIISGSVVVADNAGIFAEQMSNYLDYVRKSGKYRSKFVQLGDDGLEISIKI